jgi:hypothetical protein
MSLIQGHYELIRLLIVHQIYMSRSYTSRCIYCQGTEYSRDCGNSPFKRCKHTGDPDACAYCGASANSCRSSSYCGKSPFEKHELQQGGSSSSSSSSSSSGGGALAVIFFVVCLLSLCSSPTGRENEKCLSPAVHTNPTSCPRCFKSSRFTFLNQRERKVSVPCGSHTRGTIRLGSWGEVSRTGCNWVANGSGLGYTII